MPMLSAKLEPHENSEHNQLSTS